MAIRRQLSVRGQVQGVGFRPYVYRLALRFGLVGSVANNSNGAVIEVEGARETVEAFQRGLLDELPPLARVTEIVIREGEPLGETVFRIRTSEVDPTRRPEVTPDAATCRDCARELHDPGDRRHGYPFINCTNCGPRYSIIRGVPYDRPQTTMAAFTMCAACQAEYDDPGDRRFHAQPNACPVCGPHVAFLRSGRCTEDALAGHRAIEQAVELLRDGGIVAVKGIGGYHLACRADREDVVQRLRERKLRDGKPLAVMVPDLATARQLCELSPADEDALTSPAAPIVLAPIRDAGALAPGVAPGCRDYGVMLPYAPLHHLLFARGLGPLVMTSANLAGQPLTFRDDDAVETLGDVADAFLRHDREIFRPIDDSVVQTFRDEVVPIRRARGYAPRPLRIAGFDDGGPLASVRDLRILAVGGELKSTVCLLHGGEAVLSEHLGDLTNAKAFRHYVLAIQRLQELCGFEPDVVVCDLHPRYLATEYAHRLDIPRIDVQHHHAHVVSALAEWGEGGPVVGVSCDGTGFGPDHAVWGCELLVCERGRYERAGHQEYFPLVGADAAALETWRPAASLLRAADPGSWAGQFGSVGSPDWPPITKERLRVFEQQLARRVNTPDTSSLGRLFDAVSYVLGLCRRNRHEAEAAMALEAAAARAESPVQPYRYELRAERPPLLLSFLPTIRDLLAARRADEPIPTCAARFHETVARALVAAAVAVSQERKIDTAVVTGGCFANRILLARVVNLLETAGLRVLYHRHVPSGDGGVALGQAMAAAWQLAERG